MLIYMSATIVELSRVTSNETVSNSTWKNTLKSAFLLSENQYHGFGDYTSSQ